MNKQTEESNKEVSQEDLINIIRSLGEESKYQEQGEVFLVHTKTSFNAEFLKHDKYFNDDKEARDIYQITLTRGERTFSFTFGQSINASGQYIVFNPDGDGKHHRFTGTKQQLTKRYGSISMGRDSNLNKNFSVPTPYDVLAGMQKSDIGSFEDFCSEFGYNNDSRSAEKVYKAVVNEWQNMERLFSDIEIRALQEVS